MIDLSDKCSTFVKPLMLDVSTGQGKWKNEAINLSEKLAKMEIIGVGQEIEKEKYADFRVFFAEQYTKYYYLILTFVIGIIIIFTWDLIGFWTLFSYALNFLIFRAFASEGIKKISDAAPTPSRIINIDNSVWKDNKKLLKEFIEAELINSNSKKIQKIYDAIEYSSFLRSAKATEIIKDLINSDEKNKDTLLNELLFKL